MSLSLSEIERGLRRELEDMARRVPPPREFAYIIEELKDILRQVFGSDHMLLEAWLTPRVTWRHKCVYKLDQRESYEYEVVEAILSILYIGFPPKKEEWLGNEEKAFNSLHWIRGCAGVSGQWGPGVNLSILYIGFT